MHADLERVIALQRLDTSANEARKKLEAGPEREQAYTERLETAKQRVADAKAGLAAGLSCYLIWGFAPLVFQQMGQAGADAFEIMGHRALWSVLWAGYLVWLARQQPQVLAVMRQPKTLGLLALSTLLIAVNWTLFVWAVNNGRLLETSLGYYLNPLINMAAGLSALPVALAGQTS